MPLTGLVRLDSVRLPRPATNDDVLAALAADPSLVSVEVDKVLREHAAEHTRPPPRPHTAIRRRPSAPGRHRTPSMGSRGRARGRRKTTTPSPRYGSSRRYAPWAATSEESRAILRTRYLAAAHRWAELADHRDTTLTTRDFHPEGDP